MDSAKEDKREEVPSIQKEDHITTYDESVALVPAKSEAVASPQQSLLPKMDPYPSTEIMAAITRSYQVKQFIWSPADAQNAPLYTGEFPQDLFAVPFLADKLKYYSLVRSGVKLTFRFNSTKFQYGTLMASWVPFYDVTAATPLAQEDRLRDIWAMSQVNPTLISAQQGQSVEIVIPWVYPHPWGSLESVLSIIGTCRVRVLDPLNAVGSGAPGNIYVTVFASFHNPEIAGFSPDVSPPDPKMVQLARARLRSGRAALEAQSGSALKKQGAVTRNEPGKTVAQEAEQKSSKGIITGTIAEATRTLTPIIGSILPEAAPLVEAVGGVASLLSPIFSLLGLNKPTSIREMQKVIMRTDPGIIHGRGLDEPVRLSLDPNNMIGTTPGILGDHNPQPTLMSIMMKPTLVSWTSFDNTATTDSVLLSLIPAPMGVRVAANVNGSGLDQWQLSYAAYYSQFAKYWRGGFYFRLRFVTSSFVTARVRIAHVNEALTSAISVVSGDVVSRVVDITGDTTVDIYVPYLTFDYYVPCKHPQDYNEFDDVGMIKVYLVNPVTSNEEIGAPTIYCSVWQGVAPDFRLMGFRDSLTDPTNLYNRPPVMPPRGKQRVKTGTAEFVTQCDVVADFKKMKFEGLLPASYMPEAALVNGEDFGTLMNMLHRYVERHPVAGSGQRFTLPEWGTEPRFPDTHMLLVAPFQFMRGGIRFFVSKTDTLATMVPITPASIGTHDPLQNGISIISDFALHVEAPWYDFRAFLETLPVMDGARYDSLRLDFSGSPTATVMYSVGDDFSVGSLLCVPAQYIVPPGPIVAKPVMDHHFRYSRIMRK